MTHQIQRSARLNVYFGIATILTAIIAFFGELLSTSNYFNNLPDAGFESLGILVVVILGGMLGIAFLIFGIYNIIAGIVARRTPSIKKAKTLTVISIITKLLSTPAIIFSCWSMFDLYPDGMIFKVFYIIMAVISLISIAIDISATKS